LPEMTRAKRASGAQIAATLAVHDRTGWPRCPVCHNLIHPAATANPNGPPFTRHPTCEDPR
jgi:hypothetical protein